jgi:hypothetical protein
MAYDADATVAFGCPGHPSDGRIKFHTYVVRE